MSNEYLESASKLKKFYKYWVISQLSFILWFPIGIVLFMIILSIPGIFIFIFLTVVLTISFFIISISKSIKFYLLLGDIEEELSIPKKERAILKQLKTLALLSALLSLFVWAGVGIFAFIPQFMFISTSKQLNKNKDIDIE